MDHEHQLPAGLRVFLHSCIDSIAQVELLLLLRGSERFRTAREIAAELGLSAPAARAAVETLAARGLLDVRVGDEIAYRYKPKSDDLARYCDLLAQHYITSRQAVLSFVADETRMSIKRFSDAFKLREGDKS
jgi:predicted ArsR family transcriptional regulator